VNHPKLQRDLPLALKAATENVVQTLNAGGTTFIGDIVQRRGFRFIVLHKAKVPGDAG
jgi:hypothetical protein